MGTPQQTHLRWDQDRLLDCSVEDQVWGWSIRSSEVVHHERAKLADDALHHMIMTSLCDTKEGAPAWTEPVSIKHGIRLVTNMVVRVFQMCFKLDDKVNHSGRLLLLGKS